jgi:catechol 2,3-dioxygenase-like lactoylglutathione lyase family enzyme
MNLSSGRATRGGPAVLGREAVFLIYSLHSTFSRGLEAATQQRHRIIMTLDSGDKRPAGVISPAALAHVVFRTPDLDVMVDYWTKFLGGFTSHRNDVLAFIRYDDEHHRIAIIQAPGTTARTPSAAGMHHVAFAFKTLQDLVDAYEQRKAHSIVPKRCVNHGPTTSMYYEDPDGNTIETQVDNFDTAEEAAEFMSGPLFAENPIGVDFEPQELIDRLKSGEDDKSIKKRREIGPRGLPAEYSRK